MSGKPWTQEETDYLRHHNNQDCVEHLGRTYASINWKRKKAFIPAPPKEDAWTFEEVDYLRTHKDKSIPEISKALGRSEHAVRNKFCSEKIRKINPRNWTKEQEATMMKLIKAGKTYEETGNIIGRSAGAVEQRFKILYTGGYWLADD